MAVTRFYRPQQQQYISQFVPENLQVMQNALDRTQARADKTQGMVDTFEDELLKIKANPGEDTERLKGISKGLSDYAMDISSRELSDPQVAREVYRKIKEMRGNEDLAKIQSGYATKQAYDKLKASYEKDPKGFQYAVELDPMLKKWDNYFSQEGDNKKLSADFITGADQFRAGVDVNEQMRTSFKNMPDIGREYIRNLEEGDIQQFYKEGFTGKRFKDIEERIDPFFNTYKNMPGYDQHKKRTEMNYPTATDEQVEKLMKMDFLTIGKEFVGTKQTTTAPTALNALAKSKLENRAVALLKDGRTNQLYSKYETVNDFNNQKNIYLKSHNPDDQKIGREMQSQQKWMEDGYLNKLTDEDRAAHEKILRFSSGDITPDIEDEVQAKLRADNPSSAILIEDWVKFKNGEPVMDSSKDKIADAYAKAIGLDVDVKKVREGIEDYVKKGELFQTTDIILDASSGSSKIRDNVADQAVTAFDENYFDVEFNTGDLPIDQAAKNIITEDIMISDGGASGPEITFGYKSNDPNDKENKSMVIKFKSDIDPALAENLIKNLTGKDKNIASDMMSSFYTRGLTTQLESDTYDQKEEIQKLMPIPLPDEYNNFNLHYVKDNNGRKSYELNYTDKGGSRTIKGSTKSDVIHNLKLARLQSLVGYANMSEYFQNKK